MIISTLRMEASKTITTTTTMATTMLPRSTIATMQTTAAITIILCQDSIAPLPLG